jgi:hypothetical protein
MDKDAYIKNLKSIDLRPNRIKLKEKKEEIIMEDNHPGELETIQEIFMQVGEIEALPKGPERDLQMLRLSMIAELDAVNLYNKFAELASDSRVSKVMIDVANEEKVHAGEFEALMEYFDPSYEEYEEEGEDEVEKATGISDD